MKNNKSTIIGFVLMTLVFVGFMIYTSHQQQKQQEAQIKAQAVAVEQAATQAPKSAAPVAEPKKQNTAKPVATSSLVNVSKDAKAETINVENSLIKVAFSTKGAQIVDVTLNDYTKYAPKEERHELVHLFDPASANFNMTYYLKEGAGTNVVSTAEYIFDVVSIDNQEDKSIVTMSLKVGDGSIDHIYTIYNNQQPERDYLVDFKVKLNNFAPMIAHNEIGIEWSNRSYQNERSFENENLYTSLAYHIPGEKDIEEVGRAGRGSSNEVLDSAIDWVSFKQQFFSSALIGRSTNLRKPTLAYNTAEPKSGYLKEFKFTSAIDYSPQASEYDFSFYLGPNKFSILKELKDSKGESLEMERIIPLGWVLSTYISRWVVIPLFDLMQSWEWNIGLIILVLTLIVKLAIFPLTYKSYLSTAKMRVIKPEIDALNEKYPRKEDAMKKQQEMMALYKKAGVNPMGGCLPMLIQMPILIAMFRFFPASIELRDKAFLWSDDLSSYDSVINLPFEIPFYGDHVSLFCLLMTIVMFIYSYMNYKLQGSSQPQMAGMKFMTVYMMPLMMLFWFNNYSSGLCYYYLLSNLITILQTTIIRYSLDDGKIRIMMDNHSKNTKGKKSRFQQRYEQLMKQAEQQQKRR